MEVGGWGGEGLGGIWGFLIQELPLLFVKYSFLKKLPPFGGWWWYIFWLCDPLVFEVLVISSSYFSSSPNIWRLLFPSYHLSSRRGAFPRFPPLFLKTFKLLLFDLSNNQCSNLPCLMPTMSHSHLEGDILFLGVIVSVFLPLGLLSFPLFWTGFSEFGHLFTSSDIIWSL